MPCRITAQERVFVSNVWEKTLQYSSGLTSPVRRAPLLDQDALRCPLGPLLFTAQRNAEQAVQHARLCVCVCVCVSGLLCRLVS